MHKAPHSWSIYALVDPRDERPWYVGATVNPNKRYSAHLRHYRAKDRVRAVDSWIEQLASAGLKPALAVLESGLTAEAWPAAEREWIAALREEGFALGGNTAQGGRGPTGVIATPAQRQRMSESRTGRKLSPETIEKMRAAFRTRSAEYFDRIAQINRERATRPVSPETRTKLSAARKRRITTDETRTKMSQAHKGQPWSKARREAENRRRGKE